MESVCGMTPTERTVAGPAADLVETTNDKGLKHLVLVHHPEYRDHPLLGHDLDARLPFMEEPGVSGVAPLVASAAGAFAYPTGTAWTLSEVVSRYAENGEAPGVKSALELCYLVGEILAEAAERSFDQGMGCHGRLDPWRILLKADGQVQVIGYGVPPVDFLVWQESRRRPPREDGLRYCPPERFKGEAEDISSDLYSLALIGLEVMVGKPVYDGLLDDIREQASRGDAVRRLYQWRDRLPDTVREAVGRALKPDIDARYRDPNEFVHAVHDVLGSVDADGPSLVQVMRRVRALEKRAAAGAGFATGALTAEELAELAADLDEGEGPPLPAPRKPLVDEEPEPEPVEEPEAPRWGKVARADGEEARPSEHDKRASLRDRLRRSGGPDQAKPALDARERLKRSLRAPPSEDSGAMRIRRRRARAEESAPAKPRSARGSAAALLERLRSAKEKAVEPVPEAASPVVEAAVGSEPASPAPPEMENVVSPDRPSDASADREVRTPCGESLTLSLTATTAAAAAAELALAIHAVHMDGSGRLIGWFRLEHDGVTLRGAAPVPAAGVLQLRRAPQVLSVREVVAEGTRARLLLAAAVPVAWLGAQIGDMMGLEGSGWKMVVDGRKLGPWEILADYDETEAITMVQS